MPVMRMPGQEPGSAVDGDGRSSDGDAMLSILEAGAETIDPHQTEVPGRESISTHFDRRARPDIFDRGALSNPEHMPDDLSGQTEG